MSKGTFLQCGLLVLGVLAFGACRITTTSSVIATQTAQAETVDAAAGTAVAATLAAHPTLNTAGTVGAAVKTTQTAQAARIGTPTPMPQPPPTSTVALISCHGWYVTAKGDDDGWVLKQERDLSDCSRFTLKYLREDKVNLVTCYGMYVVAPTTGTVDLDWALRQEFEPSNCAQFILHDRGDGKFAFETCAHKLFTALDGDRPLEEQWLITARAGEVWAWEKFSIISP